MDIGLVFDYVGGISCSPNFFMQRMLSQDFVHVILYHVSTDAYPLPMSLLSCDMLFGYIVYVLKLTLLPLGRYIAFLDSIIISIKCEPGSSF